MKAEIGSDRFRRGIDHRSKRSRTLAKLMDAAVTLFAEQGVELTSVLDITNLADLAHGTFYNYFENKQGIVDAVYETVTASLVSNIKTTLDAMEDGPSQIALGSIWFVEAVTAEPHWGWMVVNSLQPGTVFHAESAAMIRSYIDNGSRQGRFSVEPSPVFLDFFLAVLVSAIRVRLVDLGPDTEQVGVQAATTHLRMLGMSPDDAERVAKTMRKQSGERPIIAPPSVTLASPRHSSERRRGKAEDLA